IEGMTDLVEISLRPGVTLAVSLPAKPLHVLVDPGQMESALFNLLLNANIAVADDGEIQVTLEPFDHTQARILINDNGTGMSDDVLARAIEPFFTTRGGEGGTGLGLSIVYGFIRQTGGQMNIESALGQGTQIEILLPLADEQRIAQTSHDQKLSLLVEDDPNTRRSVKRLLERQGFIVIAESTGEGALSRLTSKDFDLVLSDLDLGGNVDGVALIKACQEIAPNTQTLIMSGKSSGVHTVPSMTGFIEKPVTHEKLFGALK
ncbi:MAG: ATP-binding protein, partial [Sedimentitalea sp.]